MRGSVRLLLFGSLILLPVIVAAVVTTIAIRFFKNDKELYVYDLSSQSVELVARNLSTRLESLRLKAASLKKASPPFLNIQFPQVMDGATRAAFRIDNVSTKKDPRLRIIPVHIQGMTMDIHPRTLLDLEGYQGPTELIVVNRKGQVLVHRDLAQVQQRTKITSLLKHLKVFAAKGIRMGTREVEEKGEFKLVAFARVGDDLAVLQTIDKKVVLAAANPLITSAVIAAGVVLVIAILVALLLGRIIIRPLRAMSKQAEAITRGEFGGAVEGGGSSGEVAELMKKFNEMSTALQTREMELVQMQRQLLQSERINTAGRMVAAIVKELSTPLETCFSLATKTGHSLPENSDLRQLQKQIMDESNQASNILQNLSRLASQEESPSKIVEPDIVIQDILISSRPLFQAKKLQIESSLDVAGNVEISPDNLRNALLDIILFITKEATAGSKIHISLQRIEQEVAISISYTGKPLSSEQQQKLLRPMSEGKGSLELAVAAMTFEERGGRLLLASTASGNQIAARLPLAG